MPSLGGWSLWENNLVSDNKKIRKKAKNIIKRQIHMAYERAQEELSQLETYAKSANIIIGIENV